MLSRTLTRAPALRAALLRASPASAQVTLALPRRFFASQQEPLSTEPPAGEGAAAPEAPADPKDAALKALQEENAKLKESVRELNSTRIRLLAEMENVRTIAKRDVDNAKTFSIQSFAKQLLNVADNLERAVEAVPEASRTKKDGKDVFGVLYEGVAATERELKKTLASFGIEPFGQKGDKFDPNRYDALMQVPATPDMPPNTVAQLLKVGYSFKERTLRPAQVAVSTQQ